ncbi:Crp/Fnr family transcriptional regulator [Mucilaginibacter robiniae]|uniref:Crp/Fnr family transcriptional regulator n=1 Tax=Mucilaginibacter robiniae TaxID=2728022 RepID=A0A7L5E1P7_9SPHI|nr:Crp/Fnr family transcriptional regulator [Mucilaginibacter robiniae]QJD96239.1 Crp/Fnr family transcriptional regulator [Mucilaginibacter robiniae]
MLRINPSFLIYIENLYQSQNRKEGIMLRRYAPKQRMISQGENFNKVLLIKEGITKCFFAEENGKTFILEFLSKGEIVGEIEAVRKISALCNIEAITEVHAYALSVVYFKELLDRDLKFNQLLIDTFAQRITNTSSRASFQQLYTVEYSLAKLLQLIAEQQLNLSKEDMAAYLGINIRSLNRALKNHYE